MKKYNRDRRARYNAQDKNINTYARCDGYDTHKHMKIKIHVRYDGHAQTIYIPIIYGKTRDTRAQRYIGIQNTIRDIFPEIDAQHTQHIYRATAPYKKIIPPHRDGLEYIPPLSTSQQIIKPYTYTYHDTRRAKCIIFNAHDEIIYMGIFTRTIDIHGKDVKIMLHRNDREAQVKTYIPLMDKIHGMTIEEIRKHDVEFYHI